MKNLCDLTGKIKVNSGLPTTCHFLLKKFTFRIFQETFTTEKSLVNGQQQGKKGKKKTRSTTKKKKSSFFLIPNYVEIFFVHLLKPKSVFVYLP